MKLLQIGTDTEEFIVCNGEIIASCGLIGGDKKFPVKIRNGNMQEDNVLVEYAVDPCSTEDEFCEKISDVRSQVKEFLWNRRMSTVVQSSHDYEIEYLQMLGLPAVTMGCDPDYNAWTGAMNPSPNPYQSLRTAGGHVHFSYTEHGVLPCPDKDITARIIQMMDYVLGNWSLSLDKDNRRRTMYGKAGAFRFKEYGGEYRTLSNFWIESDELRREVFRRTKFCVENHSRLEELLRFNVQASINNSYPDDTITDIVQEMLHVAAA